MSDEEATLNEDSVETTEEAQVNWEQRYKDTQAAFTKSQQELAAERAAWEDDQALLGRLQERKPHFFEDDDEEEDDELEPEEAERPLTRAEFESWKREQAQERQQQTAQQMYETDFEKFVNGRELDEFGERAIRATPGVNTPEDLKKVIDAWFAREDARPPKAKPRVPHVPNSGQAATDVPNWDEMSRDEQNRYMVERVRASEAQT